MINFSYKRANDITDAISDTQKHDSSRFVAGGTNLFDLMKENVENPSHVIDINRLALSNIETLPDGKLRLGALATNADTAWNKEVENNYPLLSQAILAGASPQLRNMATDGGNPLQRTRCYYFYDTSTACNKREPGTGCSAIHGFNRIHAIIGTSEDCIATHPSDMCVALMALDATINITGFDGDRSLPISEFFRLPGNTPNLDNNLAYGDLITSIDLPAEQFKQVTYLKIRDRQSYAFAIVSVAAAIKFNGDAIEEVRVALGGVAHMPWRNTEAEARLKGGPANKERFTAFANEILADAKGFGHNDFKIELAKRAIVRALSTASTQAI